LSDVAAPATISGDSNEDDNTKRQQQHNSDEKPLSPNTVQSTKTQASFQTANYLLSPMSTPKGGGGTLAANSFETFHTPSRGGTEKGQDRNSKSKGFQVDIGEQWSPRTESSTHTRTTNDGNSLEIQSVLSGDMSEQSSDDIIRRVEEEIANARKAAQEATRRLAGVSANFKMKKEGRAARSPEATRVELSISNEIDEVVGNDGDTGSNLNDEEQLDKSTVIESLSDVDERFHLALNVIGEEFNNISHSCSESKVSCNSLDTTTSINENDGLNEKTMNATDDVGNKEGVSSANEKNREEDAIEYSTPPLSQDVVARTRNAGNDLFDKIELKRSEQDITMEAKNINSNDNGDPKDVAIENTDEQSINRKGSQKSERSDEMDGVDLPKNMSEVSGKSDSQNGNQIRSIEECSINFIPEDELKADKLEVGAELEPSINVMESSDSSRVDELEAVLSSESTASSVPIGELEAILSDDRSFSLPPVILDAVLSDKSELEAVLPDERMQHDELIARVSHESEQVRIEIEIGTEAKSDKWDLVDKEPGGIVHIIDTVVDTTSAEQQSHLDEDQKKEDPQLCREAEIVRESSATTVGAASTLNESEDIEELVEAKNSFQDEKNLDYVISSPTSNISTSNDVSKEPAASLSEAISDVKCDEEGDKECDVQMDESSADVSQNVSKSEDEENLAVGVHEFENTAIEEQKSDGALDKLAEHGSLGRGMLMENNADTEQKESQSTADDERFDTNTQAGGNEFENAAIEEQKSDGVLDKLAEHESLGQGMLMENNADTEQKESQSTTDGEIFDTNTQAGVMNLKTQQSKKKNLMVF